jgi:hypothetical protein
MARNLKRLRENIERNIERANRQYIREHGTEPPKKLKEYHEHIMRDAERERDRRENIKRGVK